MCTASEKMATISGDAAGLQTMLQAKVKELAEASAKAATVDSIREQLDAKTKEAIDLQVRLATSLAAEKDHGRELHELKAKFRDRHVSQQGDDPLTALQKELSSVQARCDMLSRRILANATRSWKLQSIASAFGTWKEFVRFTLLEAAAESRVRNNAAHKTRDSNDPDAKVDPATTDFKRLQGEAPSTAVKAELDAAKKELEAAAANSAQLQSLLAEAGTASSKQLALMQGKLDAMAAELARKGASIADDASDAALKAWKLSNLKIQVDVDSAGKENDSIASKGRSQLQPTSRAPGASHLEGSARTIALDDNSSGRRALSKIQTQESDKANDELLRQLEDRLFNCISLCETLTTQHA